MNHKTAPTKKIIYLTAVFFGLNGFCGFAQQSHAFAADVETIHKYDQLFSPPERPILFVGSSSIRKWDDLQEVFGAYRVINRGFGGSQLNDMIFFVNELVFVYRPRQIVLYIGENDLIDPATTPDSIFNRTKRLIGLIRGRLPGIPLVYISMKPSPSRFQYAAKEVAANALIRNYLASLPHSVFVNVYDLMLNEDGKPRPTLFVNDNLHMNLSGYRIWEKAVRPYLLAK